MLIERYLKNPEDKMIDIVVVGYPKSGNTWVTRLVAELVGCPVVGFLNYPDHNEIAQEGLNRKSGYQCFKSHHQFNELRDIKTNPKKIIYVIRDPRDICVSGSIYFSGNIERWPFIGKSMGMLPKGQEIYNRLLKPFLTSPAYQIEQMMHAVISGSENIHWWVRIPWVDHYKPYMENQCFFVKYEDLLSKPEQECKRIVSYLGLERDESQIKDAIEKQSFKNKKKSFLKAGQVGKANFMRSGKSEQWKSALSKKHQELFNEKLTDELAQFGYRSL